MPVEIVEGLDPTVADVLAHCLRVSDRWQQRNVRRATCICVCSFVCMSVVVGEHQCREGADCGETERRQPCNDSGGSEPHDSQL